MIINYVMDTESQVLSWQIRVAYALSKKCNNITVITHKKHNLGTLPSNLKIIEFPFFAKAPYRWFGGEYLLNMWIWNLHRQYQFDRCFMHMNYRWAYRFAPFFKITGIPVTIWYAHGTVTKWLKLAHHFADKIITSTEKGFRIPSKKVVYIGQGIDTDLFKLKTSTKRSFNILYVGRISKAKRIDRTIEILAILTHQGLLPQCTFTVIGAPLNNDDKVYYNELQESISQNKLEGHVHFKGALNNNVIPAFYDDTFLHLSFSETGSMDKSLMEALSTGCPILTSNLALFDLIDIEYKIGNETNEQIARRIINIYNNQLNINKQYLRNIVTSDHGFDRFIDKVANEINIA